MTWAGQFAPLAVINAYCILLDEIDGTIKLLRPEYKWGYIKGLAGCRKWGNEP
jgi:hypothetical protein